MKAAPSRRRPNGWSTTTTSSSAQIREIRPLCRPATTGNCRSWSTGRSWDTRGCSAWPGPSSRTPTATSIPRLLCRFVRAYQEVQPLTIGELWAVAITLRIVLVENLRRLAELIMDSSAARQEANGLADRLLGAGGHAAEPASIVLAEREGTASARRIRRAARAPAARSGSQDHPCADLARPASRRARIDGRHGRARRAPAQGAGVVTVRNIITSMRLISDVDWPELFERISLVDDVLAAGSAFRDMDFPTRNLYRSAIEELSRGADRTELDVTRAAVRAAKRAHVRPSSAEADRHADPGYHLLAGGRRAFEAAIGFRPPPSAWPGRLSRRLGIGGYVGAGAMVAALLLAMPLFVAARSGSRPAVAQPALVSWVWCRPSTRRWRW